MKDNVLFIGTCNPYKNPLTNIKLNYVIDFGSLYNDEEIKYINGIIEAEINDYYQRELKLKENKSIIINAFSTAQNFIRKIKGKKSANLREFTNFITIYKFLIKDFKRKAEAFKSKSLIKEVVIF